MTLVTNVSSLGYPAEGTYAYCDVTFDDQTFLVETVTVRNFTSLTCEYNVYGPTGNTPLRTYSAGPGQSQTFNIPQGQKYNIDDYSVGMRLI